MPNASHAWDRIIKTAVFAGSCALLNACATSMVSLQTQPPKAQVYVAAVGGNAPLRLVGETPLTMAASDLIKDLQGSGPVAVEFRKPGYTSVKTIVTDFSATDLTMNIEMLATTGLEDQERLNAMMDVLFEAQRLARVGRFDDALIRLHQLEKDAPQLAATYELEGGIFYIQKKFKESLDAYNVATKYNPKNAESVRMRSVLEAQLGVRRATPPERVPATAGSKEKKS